LVRYAALQRLGQGSASRCVRVAQSANDSNEHVRLLAIDLLAGCSDLDGIGELVLARLQLPTTRMAWHEPAHALVTLAQLDTIQARAVLPAFAAHELSWVRLYAARAATALGDEATLSELAGDANDNVRQAAITGLSDVAGHDADSLYVAQLSRDDYQLIMTTAQVLEGSPAWESTLPLLLIALRRISLEERETSRDPRIALLDRIEEFGSVQHAKALEPYLTDFDSVIAGRAAEVMGGWTGGDHHVQPRRPPEQARPSLREIRRLAGTHPVLVMQGGGEIVLQLFPFEAPTNVVRFARLADAGYFDGLTFHRVVPGFVIQGGSPGANEYMGDGPYTRDELGLRSHTRGTVGISTRGRDTGDGQIFVNLVDNVRLDHNYTIIAEVIDGMTTVDGVLEGGIIERIEWRDTP
jgi:cyclophilin family peptidyl-prolyl cis-trans isomerase